ncbi:DUF2569 domain-containing protein [Tsuneonella sp. HG222]
MHDAAVASLRNLAADAVTRISASLLERSHRVVAMLAVWIEALLTGWIGIVVALGIVKVAGAPIAPSGIGTFLVMMLPYLLVAAAPVAGYRVAAGSFPAGLLSGQPLVRLCRYGRWRSMDPVAARGSISWGPAGFMVSLIVGLLLNVPVRSLEFLLAIPAISPEAPGWAAALMAVMTIDVVVMNFFYMVCFVMALRSVPLFPRMLVFAWIADVVMQLAIARTFAGMPDAPVGVGLALQSLLEGNMQKVLISAFVWLPYLILSERVNVTFRNRTRD